MENPVKFLEKYMWWFFLAAAVELIFAVCFSDINAKISGIAFGFVFFLAASLFNVAIKKAEKYKRSVEAQLDDLRQQVDSMLNQISAQASKYKELQVEYENTQAYYLKTQEILKRKAEYIGELEAALEMYKEMKNKIQDGLSDFLEYQKSGKLDTE